MDSQPAKTINLDSIAVTIKNRKGVLVQEEVKAISSLNDKGIFDILPEHANFISIIKDNIVLHKKDGSKNEMKIGKGVLRVYENEIHIYLDISESQPASS